MATCFFTAAPSDRQVSLLFDLFFQFRKRVLLLDRGTLTTTMRTHARFAGFKVKAATLPSRWKDPGELTKDAFASLHQEWIS